MKNFAAILIFTLVTASSFANNNKTSKSIESLNFDCVTLHLSCGIDALMCDFNDTELMMEEAMALDNDIC
jgi:hypothetical protein